jgi:hypothetical protein
VFRGEEVEMIISEQKMFIVNEEVVYKRVIIY